MLTVLYVTNAPDLYGSNQSLYYLLRSIGKEINPIVLFPSKGPAVKLFESQGIECLVYPYITVCNKSFRKFIKDKVFIRPWRFCFIKYIRNDIYSIMRLKKHLDGRKIDIVHTNNSSISFGTLLSLLLRAKHVWHIREQMNPPSHQVKYRGLPRLKRRMNKADARVFVSDSCRKWWGLKEKQSYVLFDAVRSIEDCCYEPNKQRYLLFCSGYINKEKGIESAIEAYRISGLANEGIGLKVVGNWWDEGLKHRMIVEAKNYGCNSSIEFIPFQKDVKPLFQNAMAFINPSENEGMGRTTAEAMFYGCPVVGLASGGTMDLIRHGETGYLFHTVEECAELMKKVSHENQEKLIYRAQEFVKENLSVEGYGEKLLKVYQSVLES